MFVASSACSNRCQGVSHIPAHAKSATPSKVCNHPTIHYHHYHHHYSAFVQSWSSLSTYHQSFNSGCWAVLQLFRSRRCPLLVIRHSLHRSARLKKIELHPPTRSFINYNLPFIQKSTPIEQIRGHYTSSFLWIYTFNRSSTTRC